MRQYNAVKQQVPGALLMFRLGDFYELFFEDAVTAARELEITLTSRNKEKGTAIPMCGVPYHAAEGYVARLINRGYRVAICEQMEEPGPGKKLVKREITRIVTTEVEDWIFSFDYADRTLREHFNLLSLDGCGLAAKTAAISAAGAILHYLRDTQRAALDHLDRPTYYDRADSMVLDAVTVRNLELLEPVFAGDGATLIGVLDQTATGMGGRLLRQRLLRPGLDRAEIEARLDAVADIQRETILRAELRKQLAGIQIGRAHV